MWLPPMNPCRSPSMLLRIRSITKRKRPVMLERTPTTAPFPGSLRAAEHAHNSIAELIGDGMLCVGDALPSERDLSRVFETARGSLRMALNMLKRDGVVRISHGKRTVVTGIRLRSGATPSDSDMDEAQRVLLRVRRLTSIVGIDDGQCRFETAAARRLGVLAEMQKVAYDLPAFVIIDREFHTELQGRCETGELAPLFRLADVLANSALRGAFEAQTVRGEIAEQHRAIVRALERGDGRAAVIALCDQLELRIAAQKAKP